MNAIAFARMQQALRFPPPAAMESRMFARRTISISGPASA
jgi:hypothetical protein